MAISLRLSEEDSMLIKKYADLNKISVSEFVRKTILEKIEDEYDLKFYEQAMTEYKKNPVTYSHDEVKKMLELE